MQHIMLNLETMDKTPTAAIVAIGAVVFDFDTGALGNRFYQRVDLKSSQQCGGTIGADTVKWWLRRSVEARSEITTDDAVHIRQALGELGCFILRNSPHSDNFIWAKGTDFDIPIIISAMDRIGLMPTWRFRNIRDVATLEHTARDVGMDLRTAVPFEGEKHNALHGAIHQARTVIHIWQQLMAPHRQSQRP
ncbi:3'-5' exonuclease [Serratia fonticola]|uniref:3'-5' exonuclease n=1 Tax=Serratia fonticola TaxID=47917 RepID=UPI00301D23A2